jgi:alcohol dehydrogenase (NADP+)
MLVYISTFFDKCSSQPVGSLIGGIHKTQQMLNFCSKHNIQCDIEIIPIQKVNEAYKRIVNSDVQY